jgi:chromosome segregation ATPase
MKKIIFAVFLYSLSFSVLSLTFVNGIVSDPKLDKINILEDSLKSLSSELNSYKSELESYVSSNIELNAQVLNLKSSNSNISNNVVKLERSVSNLTKQNSLLKSEKNKISGINRTLSFQQKDLNTNLKDLKLVISNLKDQNNSLSSKNSELSKTAVINTAATNNDVNSIQSKLAESDKKTVALNKQISDLKSQHSKQSLIINNLNSKIKRQTQLISKAADSKSIQLLNEIKTLENTLNVVKASNLNLSSSIIELQSLKSDSNNKLGQIKIKNDAISSENTRLIGELNTLTTENNELLSSQYLFSTVNYYLIFSTLFGLIVGIVVSFIVARIYLQKRDDFYSLNRTY